MIRILIFLLSILFLSCSSKEKKSKPDEIAFRENREAYNDIIIDFEENKLHKIYPNLETNEAYHHLLKDILDRKIEIVDLKTKHGERIFKNALKKELQCLTDSVWIDENLSEVRLKEKCWNPETNNYKYKTIDFFLNSISAARYLLLNVNLKSFRLIFFKKILSLHLRFI